MGHLVQDALMDLSPYCCLWETYPICLSGLCSNCPLFLGLCWSDPWLSGIAPFDINLWALTLSPSPKVSRTPREKYLVLKLFPKICTWVQHAQNSLSQTSQKLLHESGQLILFQMTWFPLFIFQVSIVFYFFFFPFVLLCISQRSVPWFSCGLDNYQVEMISFYVNVF